MNYIERYWRDATPQDAIKEPPMVARFRDNDGKFIEKNFRLRGWSRLGTRNDDCLWYSDGVGCYRQCQVYDAPDPGEGWRLIDVGTETPKEDDQYLCPISNVWCFCNEYLRRVNYSLDSIVRRRIEQPKPKYEPFRWEDREQLRGRWIVDRTGEQEYTIDDFLNDDGVLYICGHPAEHFLNWRFLDTGEPVGRKIQ